MSSNTRRKQLFPITVLKNGIAWQDGNMIYTDTHGNWIYISEDGVHAYMYNDVSQLIRDIFKRNDDGHDYVVTGWDMEPFRFTAFIGSAYKYYSERFEE